jgi:hypothetical protein
MTLAISLFSQVQDRYGSQPLVWSFTSPYISVLMIKQGMLHRLQSQAHSSINEVRAHAASNAEHRASPLVFEQRTPSWTSGSADMADFMVSLSQGMQLADISTQPPDLPHLWTPGSGQPDQAPLASNMQPWYMSD